VELKARLTLEHTSSPARPNEAARISTTIPLQHIVYSRTHPATSPWLNIGAPTWMAALARRATLFITVSASRLLPQESLVLRSPLEGVEALVRDCLISSNVFLSAHAFALWLVLHLASSSPRCKTAASSSLARSIARLAADV